MDTMHLESSEYLPHEITIIVNKLAKIRRGIQQSAEMIVTYKYSGLNQQKNIQRNIILIGKIVVTIQFF